MPSPEVTSTDRQDINRALATLERINDDMVRGTIGATSRRGREGGTVWKQDSRVEQLAWVANWWRDHRDEDVLVDDIIKFAPPGRARRVVETAVTGLLALEQLGRAHHDEAARLEEQMTTLLELIEVRGTLQVREGINGTVKWWFVFAVIVVPVLGLIVASSQGTLLQSLLLLVPGVALIVVIKLLLLDRPIRRWRSRITELERAMPGRD